MRLVSGKGHPRPEAKNRGRANTQGGEGWGLTGIECREQAKGRKNNKRRRMSSEHKRTRVLADRGTMSGSLMERGGPCKKGQKRSAENLIQANSLRKRFRGEDGSKIK